jgi:ubiquinone/menaquinone biosynthesis C-methylase UbiE
VRLRNEKNKIHLTIKTMIKENELAHDKKILAEAEKIWGRAGLAGTKRLERRAKMIIDSVQAAPGKKILEIGCGSGTLTEKLALTGAEIIATDIFPDFLALTAKKTAGANVKTQIADAETLEGLADNSFDAVVGLSILHHLDINKTLASIYRVLKPGGIMAFSEPNMLNPQIALQKNIPALKKALNDSPDETAFFARPFKKKMIAIGFKDVIVQPFDFLHPSVPDSLAAFAEKTGDVLEKIPLLKEIAGSLFMTAKK